MIYLVDVSGSMKRAHGDTAGNSRLDSVRDTLLGRSRQRIEARADGSRSAIVLSSGNSVVGQQPRHRRPAQDAFLRRHRRRAHRAPAARRRADRRAVELAGGDRPQKVLEVLNEQRDPGHRPILIWATDNLSNIDAAGRGPASTPTPSCSRWRSPTAPAATWAPSRCSSRATSTRSSSPTTARRWPTRCMPPAGCWPPSRCRSWPWCRAATAPREALLREDLVSWAADQQRRRGLRRPATATASWRWPRRSCSRCAARSPGRPRRPRVTIDSPALAGGACLAAGAPFTAGGALALSAPSTGQNGTPPPLGLQAVPTSGAPAGYSGTISAGGDRWSVAGVAPGGADGLLQLDAVATDALGRSARALQAPCGSTPPRPPSLLVEGGAPLPARAPAASRRPARRPCSSAARWRSPPRSTTAPARRRCPRSALDGAALRRRRPDRGPRPPRGGGAPDRLRRPRGGALRRDRDRPHAAGPHLHQSPGPGQPAAGPRRLQRHRRHRPRQRHRERRGGPAHRARRLQLRALRLAGRRKHRRPGADRPGRQSRLLPPQLHGLLAAAHRGDHRKRPADRPQSAFPAAGRAARAASTSGANVVLSLGGGPFQNGATISSSGSYTLVATATDRPPQRPGQRHLPARAGRAADHRDPRAARRQPGRRPGDRRSRQRLRRRRQPSR